MCSRAPYLDVLTSKVKQKDGQPTVRLEDHAEDNMTRIIDACTLKQQKDVYRCVYAMSISPSIIFVWAKNYTGREPFALPATTSHG